MRKWINLFEGIDWHEQIDHGYDTFLETALDLTHDRYDPDEEKPDLSRETFHAIAEEMSETITKAPLYRGIVVDQLTLENAKHLGIFYSTQHSTAQGFSRGGSPYDGRFDQNFRGQGVIVEIAPPHIESIDWPITCAMHVYNGEAEIRFFENEPVTIRKITDEMGRGIWQHLWGQQYLT